MLTTVHLDVVPCDPVVPFWRLGGAFPGPWSALLDSALPHARQGRWSYLLPDPDLVVDAFVGAQGAVIHRCDPAGHWRTEHVSDDPLAVVRRLRVSRGAPDPGDAPFPFRSGAIGWFGHGAGRFTEQLPETAPDRDGLPDLRLMFGDVLLAHRADDGRTWLACTGRGPDADTARRAAAALREAWRPAVESWAPPPPPPPPDVPAPIAVRADLDAAAYADAVRTIQADILAGRVFEVTMTQTLEADLAATPWDLYRMLRAVNPAPFAAFLRTPEATVVSSSPERYLRLDADGRVESRPIKGTRPRVDDPVADALLRDDLAASAKDRAENVMIVDLVRNDLGRVCETGSVRVPELCAVEGYATVWQLVSTVSGRLRPGCDALDLLRACHPPGSMTGAPKIEALKVIDERETCRRGVYAGGLGWWDDGGALDLHVVIRTVTVREGRARFGVGGAVTADSDPHAEYLESMDKARALIRALGLAEAATRPGSR